MRQYDPRYVQAIGYYPGLGQVPTPAPMPNAVAPAPPQQPAIVGNNESRMVGAGLSALTVLGWLGSATGSITGAYHGYKRNRGSLGWAIGWAILGGLFWPITIPVSLAQGYADPRGR